MKIKTQHWAPPIPHRQYDWTAVLDDYDYGDPIGTGKTEKEAIQDLTEQLELGK